MAYGTLAVDTLNSSTGVLASQNGMTGIAKAWVSFSAAGSTCTIYKSFNVSSITYTSTGLYNISFTTAMADANYCAVCSAGQGGVLLGTNSNSSAQTTTTLYLRAVSTSGSNYDTNWNYVSVFD